MKYIYHLVLISLLSALSLEAQTENFDDAWYNLDRNRNFYEIQDKFNEHWQGKVITSETPKEERGGWKQFKRWEWFWEQRVYPTGEFPAPGHVYYEYVKYRTQEAKSKTDETQSANSWTHLGPTTSSGGYQGLGRINCVVEHPDYDGITNETIWVGSASGGIWKTTDGGDNWSTNTDELSVLGIGDIVIDPDTPSIMYVATGDGDGSDTYSVGVLKSTDGGDTWNTTGFQRVVTNFYVCRRMIMDHSDNNTLFVATNGGLYRTTNAGTTWSQEINDNIYDVKMHPTDSDIIYASGNEEFYKSTDGGDNFTQITSGIPNQIYRIAIAVTPDEPDYVYILASSTVEGNTHGYRGVYRSSDAGDNFTTRSTSPNLLGWYSDGSDTEGQGWYDLTLAVDPTDAELVIVGGVNMHKSTDGGQTWNCVGMWTSHPSYNYNGADEVHADHHMLYFPTADRFYTANDGGIDISTNSGENWTYIGSGIQNTQFYRLGVSQQNSDYVICGAQDNSTFIKTSSTFNGTIGTGDGMECLIDHSSNSTWLAASYYGNIYKTTTTGNSWFETNRPNENGGWVTPFMQDPNTADNIFGGYTGVWKSDDKGTNWTKISDFSNSTALAFLHVSTANSDYIYTGKNGAMWKTTDGGTNWSSVNLPSGSQAITYMASNHSDPNEIWVSSSGYSSGNKVYHSTDGGSSWTNISGSLPNVPCNTIIYQPDVDDRVWVGTDIGVWYRGDNDNDWQAYNEDLPNVICNELEIYQAGNKLRLASYGRGLWEVDLPAPPPAAPVLATPANSSNTIEIDVDLTWNAVQDADSYILQVSTDANFNTTVVNESGIVSTSYDLGQESISYYTPYYWRVKTVDEGNESEWSSAFAFTTKKFLVKPNLVTPTNMDEIRTITPSFDWDNVQYADNYDIEIAIDNQFVIILESNTINNSHYTLLSNLQDGITFHWRVKANANSGEESVWSDVYQNTIDLLDPPVLNTPANLATVTTVSPSLTWQMDDNAESYDVEVSTANNFSSPEYSTSVATNSYTPVPALNDFDEYWWRVRTVDGAFSSDWSTVRQFSVNTLTPPNLQTPIEGEALTSDTPLFNWTNVSGADTYRIQFSEDQNFNSIESESTPASSMLLLTAGTLEHFVTYYWRVRAEKTGGESDWSVTRSFTIEFLDAPELTLPADAANSLVLPVALQWNSVQGALSYYVEVDDNSDFSSPALSEDVGNNTTYNTSGLLNAKTYYWRVKAVNGDVESQWAERSFTSEPAAIPAAWSFSNNPESSNISVPAAIDPQINGRSFVNGDGIGFFYNDSGTMECAGYGTWNGGNLFIEVFGDDANTPDKDGFDDQETYTVMVWDAQIGSEHTAGVTYSSGNDYWSDGTISMLGSLSAPDEVTLNISLNQGWNLISSNVDPQNAAMPDVFSSIVDDILIVKNNSGAIYVPQYNINTIGNWNVLQAYNVYLNTANETLSITGARKDPETTTLSLSQGWNSISYIPNSDMSIVTALAGINGNFLIVKKGNLIYVPQYNINTIGNMQVTQGYQIYMTSADNLTYPAGGGGKINAEDISAVPEFFVNGFSNPENNSVLIIENAEIPDGFEIGVWTSDDQLVGSAVVQGGNAAVIISGDVEYSDFKDGAVAGEKLIVKALNPDTKHIFDLEFENLSDMITGSAVDELQYTKGAIVVAKPAAEILSTVDAGLSISAAPNPANGMTKLNIVLPESGGAVIKIYDMKGSVVERIDLDSGTNGINELNFNTSKLLSGVYNLTIEFNGRTASCKFVVNK